MSRSTRSVEIGVDLNALRQNFAVAKNCCPDSRLFAVLKSDAYGHGAVKCALALDEADAIAVVCVEEAVILRDGGVTKPILVLQGPQDVEDVAIICQQTLDMVIHEKEQINVVKHFFERSGVSEGSGVVEGPGAAGTGQIRVWLKVDSGMGRLGFSPKDVNAVVSQLSAIQAIDLCGLMAHFANADQPDHPSNFSQLSVFEGTRAALDSASSHSFESSVLFGSHANSAAILAQPDSHLDWVRPGIMLYGSNPLADPKRACGSQLQPAMSVTAPIISIREFPAGATIGYGDSFRCPQPMLVGLVACGYGDGLPRVLENASVWIAGYTVPIIGRVSMDSFAVDLTDISDHKVSVGSRVELWGKNHSVEHLASSAKTIPYELFCSIRGRRSWVG